jgi:hypothetical protein
MSSTAVLAPVRVSLHGVQHTGTLLKEIRAGVDRLSELVPRFSSCHVAVHKMTALREPSRAFEVNVDLLLPDHQVIANGAGDSAHGALRQALETARRDLQRVLGRDAKAAAPQRR